MNVCSGVIWVPFPFVLAMTVYYLIWHFRAWLGWLPRFGDRPQDRGAALGSLAFLLAPALMFFVLLPWLGCVPGQVSN